MPASLLATDDRPSPARIGSDRTMNILDDVRHGAAWSLRYLGLDAGRALANSQPPPAQVSAGRAEQLAFIRAGIRAQATHGQPGRNA